MKSKIHRMRQIRNKMIDEYVKVSQKRMELPWGSKEEKELGVIEASLLDKWGKINDDIISMKVNS